jgi:formylglycine-generating enzyme
MSDRRLPALVAVPGGSLAMGSDHGRPDERPRHNVDIAPFLFGRTPITRAEYACFIAATGAAVPPWWNDLAFGEPDQPVVGITWFEADAYATWLGEGFCLPTEAQWEWAARGGLVDAATAWGDALPEGEVPRGLLPAPWRVAQGKPNGYGLLDISTIVHEWCSDWYLGAYDAPPAVESPQRRASRGGSWRHHVRWSPPSARSSLPPSFRYADYGFRVVRDVR